MINKTASLWASFISVFLVFDASRDKNAMNYHELEYLTQRVKTPGFCEYEACGITSLLSLSP